MLSLLQETDSVLPRVCFDWSRTKRLDVLYPGTDTPVKVGRTVDLLATLSEPHEIICESTVESYQPHLRRELVLGARKSGHRWFVFNPRLTSKVRRQFGWEKSDTADTHAIAWIAENMRSALRPIPESYDPDSTIARKSLLARVEACNLRRYGTISLGPQGGVNTTPDRDRLADWCIEYALPPSTYVPEEFRPGLLDSSFNYSKVLIGAVAVGVRHSSSRAEFESVVGLSVNGYPSQLRSDIMHHVWRSVRNRHPDYSRSTFRRAIRWLRSQLAGRGIPDFTVGQNPPRETGEEGVGMGYPKSPWADDIPPPSHHSFDISQEPGTLRLDQLYEGTYNYA